MKRKAILYLSTARGDHHSNYDGLSTEDNSNIKVTCTLRKTKLESI
jgi:hypothetical protein